MHFVKSMHIAHRSTSWSEHLEFAWKNTCVYENNKYIICKCNTPFPLDLVWSILVTQAECWKKQSTQDMRKWIYVYNDMFVAQFLCFIPYHISQSSACYVYKQYNVYTYTFMYNIYIYIQHVYLYVFPGYQSSIFNHSKIRSALVGIGGWKDVRILEVGIHN